MEGDFEPVDMGPSYLCSDTGSLLTWVWRFAAVGCVDIPKRAGTNSAAPGSQLSPLALSSLKTLLFPNPSLLASREGTEHLPYSHQHDSRMVESSSQTQSLPPGLTADKGASSMSSRMETTLSSIS